MEDINEYLNQKADDAIRLLAMYRDREATDGLEFYEEAAVDMLKKELGVLADLTAITKTWYNNIEKIPQ